jgi:hypothetical protein
MAALICKGTPLDWACCGSRPTCVAVDDEQDSLESESRRAASHDDTKAGCSATIPRPPIGTSSADTLTLTRSNACSSTFLDDDDDDELYDVIADLLGSSKLATDAANLGNRIVLSMGYKGGARSTAYKSEKEASNSTASKSTASSSSHASPAKDGAGDNTSPCRSAGQSHIPYWIGMDEKKNEPKLLEVAAKEPFAKINKSLKKPLKASLCKWIKKTKRAPPSDISTASSAFSSLGFYSAWAE